MKFKDNFKLIRQEIKALSYNYQRNNLSLTRLGAINSVQSSAFMNDQDSINGKNNYSAVSALQFKKDGLPLVCYGYTLKDHCTYAYKKLQRLISNGLLTAQRLKGSLMFLSIPDDA